MKIFIGLHGNKAIAGSFNNCIGWGREVLNLSPQSVVKILKARPNETAIIIGDLTKEGYFPSRSYARKVAIKRIRKALENEKKVSN